MSRTRLRGIELAGIRLAVESPSGFSWAWPTEALAAQECSPLDPDLYLGVRVGDVSCPDWDPISYSFTGGSFDVGRVGEDWVILVHGHRHRCEKLARFDADFRQGELILSRDLATAGAYPLDEPILDVALLQRIVLDGGLVVSGTAIMRRGRALVFLGADSAQLPAEVTSNGWAPMCGQSRVETNRLIMRQEGDSFRVDSIPGSHGGSYLGSRAQLDAIHLVSRSQSRSLFAQRLESHSAAAALLRHVHAPLHDPDSADRMLLAAERLTSNMPVLELRQPAEDRTITLAWGDKHAVMGFAPPLVA